ncbi:DUF3846 domain-containing protein [Oscillibacter ruminantium]|uniref:DUF3846 domain-containing protein n=1 Tax=Oscillibacter ruminantium TaxID=1263547 RepID=UPI00031DB431|nr:DUF3846 domain-containing protein [Oscillibacter ruminantium]
MKVLLVKPNQIPRAYDLEDSLDAMQALVGGSIQAVFPFQEPVALVCHEEGKLLGLPLNRALSHPDTGEVYDIISGPFFLCAAREDSETFESLTPAQIDTYTQQFYNPQQFIRTENGLIIFEEVRSV